MISMLTGTVEEVGLGEVIIHLGGIGFQVFVPENLLPKLPLCGQEVTLSIYTHVREDQLHLYGFETKEERRLFKELLHVSRIGPSVALKVLSSMGVEDFVRAILTDDVDSLKEIPGIGKKTAQRMILDLKSRLDEFSLPTREEKKEISTEILSGLMNLGYTPKEAREAITHVMDREKVEDESSILKLALKELARR